MPHTMIDEDEKKAIFDRLTEVEKNVETFIPEAQEKINDLIHQINGLNKRIEELEENK